MYKNDPDLSWNTFNLLLESVNLNDQIGHLYIVDIKFDLKNASEKQIVYNEIYPPIIEKQKTIDANEKSIYQLLDNLREGQNGPLSYKVTAKNTFNHASKKIYSELLNWKNLRFLVLHIIYLVLIFGFL